MSPVTAHMLDELSSEEISQLAKVVRDNFSNSIRTGKVVTNSSLEEEGEEKMMLFNYITLAEPTRKELSACGDGDAVHERRGEVMIIVPWTGEAYKYVIAVKSLEVVKVEQVNTTTSVNCTFTLKPTYYSLRNGSFIMDTTTSVNCKFTIYILIYKKWPC